MLSGRICPCRSTCEPCPERLATGFAAPDDHIRTLYDNIETTISRHPQVNSCITVEMVEM